MNKAIFVVLLGAFDYCWAAAADVSCAHGVCLCVFIYVVSGLQFKLVEFITCYLNPADDEHPWGNMAFYL